MLAALTSVRGTPTSAQSVVDGAPASELSPGEVAVPVALASAALAATVAPGDVVDIVAVPDDAASSATVLAAGARVLRSAAGGSFGTGSAAVVLVAVPAADGLPLSAAVGRTLTVVIRTG